MNREYFVGDENVDVAKVLHSAERHVREDHDTVVVHFHKHSSRCNVQCEKRGPFGSYKLRQQIAQEGDIDDLPEGFLTTFAPGALWWESDRPVWVTARSGGDPGLNVVGRASEFEREDDGRITAKIDWTDDFYGDHPLYGLTVSVMNFESEGAVGDPPFVITKGKIMEVFLDSTVPWAQLEEKK